MLRFVPERNPSYSMYDGKKGFRHNGMMAKRKTTVYLEEDLLRAAKVAAARSGRREYQVFEAALKQYLGLEGMEAIWARSDLGEKEALDLAYGEVHAAREKR